MRKPVILSILLTVCLLTVAFTGGTARAEQPAGTDYRDIFIKANQQVMKMNSYHLTVELTASMTFQGKDVNVAAAGELDAAIKPLLMKNVMTVAADIAGQHNEFAMTQYFEEAGDKVNIYTQTGPKWVREVRPNLYPSAKYDEAARKSLDRVVKAITSVTLVRETDEALVLEVAIDFGSLLAGLSEELIYPDGKKLAIPKAFFEDLKEFVQTVEIDKNTLLVSSASFDLSPLISSIGGKIVEAFKLPADKTAMAMEVLDSLQVQGNIAISRYNAIEPIIIPREAKTAPLAAPAPAGKPDAVPPAKQPAPAAGGEAPVKIGANLEMSGAQSSFGKDVLEGARLAVKEINAAGGVVGRRLELVVRDNASSPPESAHAAAALIAQDRVVAIVGAITSFDTLAAAPLAENGRVPLISPSATNPRVTAERGQVRKYIFRAPFIDPYQGQVMSRFAIDSLHAGRAAVIIDKSSDYSQGLAQVFQDNFRDRGGAIVAQEFYLQKDKDFGAQLQRVGDASPDVIFVPGYYREVGLLIRQAREMGITIPILGGDGWDSPRIVGYAGADALNDTYFCNHFAVGDSSPQAKKFAAAYSKEYGKLPNALAALGYDSVQILAAAVKKAGDADPVKIRDAIEKAEYDGVTGRLSFDAFHNPLKSAVVMKFVDGRQTFVQRIDP